MKDGQISGYFDTTYMAVHRIEQILHNYEDKNSQFFIFRMTLVIYSLGYPGNFSLKR